VPSLLQGDPGRLRQIVVNLASNAIKFTTNGEVSIHVSLEQEDNRGVILRFEITDTGIGISQDQIDILWDPFTQGDASIKRRFGGTGLGLSISKQLVELMGGRIGVNSVEGERTTFWFTVVLRRQPVHAELPQGEEREIKGTHVLFVDDNATNRRLLSSLLDSWGCRYEEAHNAESALAKLYAAVDEGNPFTVALLDMYIPGMTGEELGVKIKEDTILRDTILVMLTPLGRHGNLKEAGFAAYLTKPIKQSSLYDILISVLAKKEHPVEKPDESIITSHSINDARRQKIRILLAEDNVINQKVAMKILEKFGYRADAVANGHEAIKALESIPYDLVLMDCQMPEMDGYAATKIVRDMNTKVLNRNVPIIAMTANALPADRFKCIESGMDDYLPKPVKPSDLAECIHKWISSSENAKRKIMASLVTNPADQVFDKEHLLERLMGDKDILPSIIEQFINDLPERIETLKKALHQGDALIVQIQAHSIKSAAGNIGANALQGILLQIKTAAKDKNLAKAASFTSALDEQLEILQQALSVYLTNPID
jgi:CheY-like chemotaxis protein